MKYKVSYYYNSQTIVESKKEFNNNSIELLEVSIKPSIAKDEYDKKANILRAEQHNNKAKPHA